MIVISDVIWQNSKIRWLVTFSFGRIRSNSSNLPDARNRSGLDNLESSHIVEEESVSVPATNPTGIVEMLSDLLLQFIEHERMITYLAELHDSVHHCFGMTTFAILKTIISVSRRGKDSFPYFVLGQNDPTGLHVSVHHSLQCRHVTFDHVFDLNDTLRVSLPRWTMCSINYFIGQLRFDFFLQAS